MSEKTVLFASLNWGLGHAVRDIPLIKQLLKNNYNVYLCGEGWSGKLLKQEFPELKYIEITSFKIKYPTGKFFFLKLLIQIPNILRGIRKEQKILSDFLKKNKVDLIISDNRYGIYSKNIPSVFITHQISPRLPIEIRFLENKILKIHKKRINKFDLCLIPDFSGNNNLSGKLSHIKQLPENYKFIGILSDFANYTYTDYEKKYDIAVILSGPEPQRSILENKIIEKLKNTDKKIIIISGKPQEKFSIIKENIRFISHLSRKEMMRIILSSDIIICRSGYTSIMDLVTLNKKAILIPTPGQTEQEYLADYISKKGCFIIQKQNNSDIISAVEKIKNINKNCFNFSNFKKDNFIEIINSLFY